MRRTVRIGTRGSALALAQSEEVRRSIERHAPDLSPELVPIRTSGDKILDEKLSEVGGKGLFVKEIEEALLDKTIDIAVHSVKDLPAVLPEGLGLIAFPPREDARDVFLSMKYSALVALPPGATIGTSSVRRRAQLLGWRNDLKIVPLRGNVPTRVERLLAGELDAVILAAAGLRRLGLHQRITEFVHPEIFVPAIGQGALGIEARLDSHWGETLSFLDHADTAIAVRAERSFLAELEGSCQVPIAAHGTVASGRFRLRVLVASLDGHEVVRGVAEGATTHASDIARDLACRLLEKGGRRILDKIYGRI